MKEKAFMAVVEIYLHQPDFQDKENAMQCLSDIFASIADTKTDEGGGFDWRIIGDLHKVNALDPEGYEPGDAFKSSGTACAALDETAPGLTETQDARGRG